MDVALSVLIGFFYYVVVKGVSVPPAICFEQFKWEDCGMAPKPVLYYYKSGSRCEVGMWRGCLPNPNMFVDEYECVQTCIFSLRAQPGDFHKFQAEVPLQIDDLSDKTTESTTTGTGGTASTDVSEVGGGEEQEAVSEGDTAAPVEEGGEAAPEAPATEAPAEGDGEAPAEGGEPAPAEGGEVTPAEEGEPAPEGGGEDAPPAE